MLERPLRWTVPLTASRRGTHNPACTIEGFTGVCPRDAQGPPSYDHYPRVFITWGFDHRTKSAVQVLNSVSGAKNIAEITSIFYLIILQVLIAKAFMASITVSVKTPRQLHYFPE